MDKPLNPNYCGTIVKLPKNRIALTGLDNLEGVSIFGFQVLISKDTDYELGVFFPAEVQLSDRYCYSNDLHRHGSLNLNPDVQGYLEDNRRVRAIKFRGNLSSGLFMPLSSLEFTGINTSVLKEGDEFDIINGFEICRKYVTPCKSPRNAQEMVDRGFIRADKKFFPEHIDTENFFKNFDKIDGETEVIVTQKLHGTSIRIAHTLVNRKPSIVEKIARFFGAKIATTEYAYLYGSRKVIKDANNPNQNHYYETDIWTQEGKKLDGILPENYIVYAELVGYTPEGAELQRNYSYGLPMGTCKMYVYRITTINEKGLMTDLAWEQVKEFCRNNGLKYVPELLKCKMKFLTDGEFHEIKKLLDCRHFESTLQVDGKTVKLRNALCLGTNKDIVDEGVCVRADGLLPKILKAKSPKFLEHETKILDTGEEDIESLTV